MGQPQTAAAAPEATVTKCASRCEVAAESCVLDLGSPEAKGWIGVQQPHRAEVLAELKRSTAARVCTGRAGPRPRTLALLRFLADHSRSKDTVLKEVPEEWVKTQGLLEVRSEISDKNLYLTRPDMGRRLSPEAIEALKAQCVANPDVQVVVSDGLSTDAITVNYEEILPPLLSGLKQAGLKVGTPFFVRYGRVKIEDQIGEILGAKVVILLVGERPGAGAVGKPLLLRRVFAARGDHRRSGQDLYFQYSPGRYAPGRSRGGDCRFGQTHAGAEGFRHQHDSVRRHHACIRFNSPFGDGHARDCLSE
ncbi:ethanolamine ammonia-lyase small subunit [Klebsiella michiganensis]|nr:ethanolamine ammonia-lyase small subunit [Klebsiella michiganensis]